MVASPVAEPRYRVGRRIARGGMAEVFEAVVIGRAGFQRKVALKQMIPESAGDPSFARMFVDEARIASCLHHPNIVGVLDYGVLDGRPFQVLEFIDGLDAGKLARRGHELDDPMTPVAALHVCREIAVGLHHAHGARDHTGAPLDIVHRDISPGNVLVGWDGSVKLADFGIARAHGREESTEAGVTKGKMSYMAPEQALGMPLDPRADVHALGCTLHALLTGRSPLRGTDLGRRLVERLDPELDPSIPEQVAAIIRRATYFDRTRRYETSESMAAAIEQTLGTQDPRGPFLKWLERVHPSPAPAPAAPNLWDIVLVATDEVTGAAEFVTETAAAGPSRQKDDPPTDASGVRARGPVRPWARPAAVAGALSLGLVVAFGIMLSGASNRVPGPLVGVDVAIGDAGPLGHDAEAQDVGSDAHLGVDPGSSILDAGVDAQPARPDARPRTRRDTGPSRWDTGPPPRTPDRDSPLRYLRVIGAPGYASIDNAPPFPVPGTRRFPIGAHELTFRSRDGTITATRSVVLDLSHTQLQPLRVTAPEPPSNTNPPSNTPEEPPGD